MNTPSLSFIETRDIRGAHATSTVIRMDSGVFRQKTERRAEQRGVESTGAKRRKRVA
jgi:hypothetical protein